MDNGKRLSMRKIGIIFALILISCSSNKKDKVHEETMEAEIIHDVDIDCDFKKKKKCKASSHLKVVRETGLSKPIIEESKSILDHPAVQGAIGK